MLNQNDFVRKVLDHPPLVVGRLEAKYQLALENLVYRQDLNTSNNQQLARRIARHVLQASVTGFTAMKFFYSFERGGNKPFRQRTLEGMIWRLGNIQICREYLADYYRAALKKTLYRKLWIDWGLSRFSLRPARILASISAKFLLNNDREKINDDSIVFGLSGFYLLSKSGSQELADIDFQCLMEYAKKLAYWCEWKKVGNVVRVMCAAKLTPEQQLQLHAFLLSLSDVEQYPWRDSSGTKAFARLEFWGPLSWGTKLFFSGILALIKYSNSRRKFDFEQVENERLERWAHYSLIERRKEMLQMLCELSNQYPTASNDIESMLSNALVDAISDNRYGNSIDEYFEALLPLSLRNPETVKAVFQCLGTLEHVYLSQRSLEKLNDSNIELNEEVSKYLLTILQSNQVERQWAEKILLNVPKIDSEGLSVLETAFLEQETSNRISVTLFNILHHLYIKNRNNFPTEIFNSIILHILKNVSNENNATNQFNLMLLIEAPNLEYLRQLFSIINTRLQADPLYVPKALDLVRGLLDQFRNCQNPQATSLAVCCWIAGIIPEADDKTLEERIQEAINLLSKSANIENEKKVINLLISVYQTHPDFSVVIAKALRTIRYSEMVIPVLATLLAVDPDERNYTQSDLFITSLQTLASLNPLCPSGLDLLKKHWLLNPGHPSRKNYRLTPAVVYEQIFPIVPNDISPDVITPLLETIDELKNSITYPSKRRRFQPLQSLIDEDSHFDEDGQLTLYCLYALAHISTLNQKQQELIWYVHINSPYAAVKALTLLVLSRQRPISEKVYKLLLDFLKPHPKIMVSKTMQLCQSISVSTFRQLLYELPDEGRGKSMKEQIINSLLTLATSKFGGAQIGLVSEGKTLLGSDSNALNEIIGLPRAEGPFSDKTNMLALSTDQAYQTLFEYYLKDIADFFAVGFDS